MAILGMLHCALLFLLICAVDACYKELKKIANTLERPYR